MRWKYQRYIKRYIASVQSMDRQIGRLLDYLEQHDLMENTLVVYSSDQGFFLGENGWFDKRWMDEVSSRVPLLMAVARDISRPVRPRTRWCRISTSRRRCWRRRA